MLKNTFLSSLFLSLLVAPAYSGTMGKTSDSYKPLIMLSAGPAWQSGFKTQTLTLQPGVQNTYVPNNAYTALGSGAIFLAVEAPFYQTLKGALGVALTGSGSAKMSGNIWQDANPNFSNFTYNYKVNQFRVAFKARIVETEPKYTFKSLQPYLSGEVGGGFNRSTGYLTTQTIDTAVLQPLFKNNTVSSVTYAFGAGLQGKVNSHVQVAVGYEIADWGKYQLGPANGQTTQGGLGASNLYVNELQFSILYTA